MTLNQTKPIHLNHGKSKTKLERVGGHIAGTRRSFLNNYHPILLLGRGTTTVCPLSNSVELHYKRSIDFWSCLWEIKFMGQAMYGTPRYIFGTPPWIFSSFHLIS